MFLAVSVGFTKNSIFTDFIAIKSYKNTQGSYQPLVKLQVGKQICIT